MKLLVFAFVLSCSATTAAAQADPYEDRYVTDVDPGSRPSSLSALLYVPWYWGFGIGVIGRFEIPIVPQGFIRGQNDEVSLEPSFGFGYSSYGVSGIDDFNFTHLTPALYGLWSFYFSEEFRLYGGLGLGYSIAFYSGDDYGESLSYFFWDAVFGMFYNFSANFSFRAELGYQGPKVGVAILF